MSLEWSDYRALGPKEVDAHSGTYCDFVARHQVAAFEAAERGQDSLQEFATALFPRVYDTRTLRAAVGHLDRYGGDAPGPDGLVLRDLSQPERLELVRALSRQIRSGSYRHGPVRAVRIPKSSGRGRRELAIENLADRIVARAVVEILQPLLAPSFDSRSYCREQHGPWEALAHAERLLTEGRDVWITEDIRDAFGSVPLGRLLDVLRNRVPADDLLRLVSAIVDTGSRRGLRQGSCLSPLLMNVYLDHFLDRPWRRAHPSVPLLRYMDDLLVLCGAEEQPEALYKDLRHRLRGAAMPLKGKAIDSIRDLGHGKAAAWLGYLLSAPEDSLIVRVALDGKGGLMERLQQRLMAAHGQPDSPLRAIHVIKGMVDYLAPCYPHMDCREVYRVVREVAQEMAFEEVGSRREFTERWRRAHGRWLALRDRLAQYGHGDQRCDSAAPEMPSTPSGASDEAPF